jgi:hypothetical protein
MSAVRTSELLREALRRSMRAKLPVGYGLWDTSAMLWGYVLSVGRSTFRVREVTPGGRPDAEETYAYAKVAFFDLDPVYGARLAALGRRPGEDLNVWTTDARGIARTLRHASASGAPVEVKTRRDRRRWRARVVAMRSGWAELVELDDLCRDLHSWIVRVADLEAVSVDASDAYLRELHESSRTRGKARR